MNRICNDDELAIMIERIQWFIQQMLHLRRTESNLINFRAAAGGFISEIDRMQLEVREYLSSHPTEQNAI